MIRTSQLLIWLAILLILMGGIFVGGYFFVTRPAQQGSIVLYPDVSKIVEAKVAPDKSQAIGIYQNIVQDVSKTSDEKALAEVVISGLKFVNSGSIEARLEDIRNLKARFNDPTVSVPVRAAALSILGREYNLSGRNPEVLKELYKDAPFSDYEVKGNPDLSSINMEKASYAMFPSTVAAITIAQTASGIDFLKKPTANTPARIALAEEYLQKADAAALEDEKDNPTYTSSDRYSSYLLARAFTVGRLAITKGEPYKSEYRAAFENVIALAQSGQRTLPNELILNARFVYARVLLADNDAVGAKAQLDEMARILNGLPPNEDKYSFVWLLRNEHNLRPKGSTWGAIQGLFKESPDFEAAAMKMIGNS